ncbi:rhamnogalacturonan lyase [Alteromonas australica]|uniref:rhamnogalacturonan lyase n=1 Tax=Alteromonas australica TaxID=589873 RepID=UPI0005C52E7A|nr:rhamnogalacturonan lyase [Alteromonas australica]
MKKKVLFRIAVAVVILNFVVFGCRYQMMKDTSTSKWRTPAVSAGSMAQGLVAIATPNSVILSWRAESEAATQGHYNLFRNHEKIATLEFNAPTFFVDKQGKPTDSYYVLLSTDEGIRPSPSMGAGTLPWKELYLDIPLDKPEDAEVNNEVYSYSANDLSVADLTGDGSYEILVKWYPSNAKDNSQAGFTGKTYIDAYTMTGEKLWRIDLGTNIRSGAHYTQFIAYDFDNNGRAEVAMKTADGTVDGRGNVIGDATRDYRNSKGYVLDGAEYLTVFDGLTGEALDTVNYIPERGKVSAWGDAYGNRVDRFLAGVAYLDGATPSMIFTRGYYTRAVIAAFHWTGTSISMQWLFDSSKDSQSALGAGQGAHSLSVGDVDGDGNDEIIFGGATIDNDGQLLYSTALGHGDALHLADVIVERPGLEVFMVHETPSAYTKRGAQHAIELHDAGTGEIIWSHPGDNTDVGRGVTADIDPRFAGMESWASKGGLIAANGEVITSAKPDSVNFAIWWDGDLTRELLDDTRISKWDYEKEKTVTLMDGSEYDIASNNGTKATPGLVADILGDWREEVIWRTKDSRSLRLFSTTLPTQYKRSSFMANRQYRTAIAWQNVGYNQPPQPSFSLSPSQ